LIAGRAAFQANGIPAALIALTVKKTIDARLKMIVTMAMKFVSTLKRLKKRRTAWLCKNRAMISPAAKRPANAIRPRKVT
jgi:hypothetical protein